MKITICVPMYNESSIIESTARALWKYMTEHFGDDFEIIFADDGSRDDSARLVDSLNLSGVRVVGYGDNRGKGSAVRTAVLASSGDVVIFTDADLAYGLDVIEEAVRALNGKGYSAVVASRAKHPRGYEGYTFIRKLASKTYICFLNALIGIKISDAQCGFKAFEGDLARKIFSLCKTDNFAFDLEVILLAQKLRVSIYEMPAMIINHRESKVSVLRDAPRMLREAFRIKKRVKELKF